MLLLNECCVLVSDVTVCCVVSCCVVTFVGDVFVCVCGSVGQDLHIPGCCSMEY